MMDRVTLPIEALTVDPLQSRDQAWSGDEIDQQLAASIEEDGLYHDILVRPVGGGDTEVATETADGSTSTASDSTASVEENYQIIAGSRRYHAAMEAGYETVPCKVWESDDLAAAWASLQENTDRRELSEQEIAQQLKLIYELVRPLENSEAPADTPPATNTDTQLAVTQNRFETDQAAVKYLAKQFTGRTDKDAISLVRGHLRTASLPPTLQALFKPPTDRTAQEETALDNYGIDTRATLGSGGGKSGTSKEVVALHDAFEEVLDTDTLDATDAVLETVGSLRFEEMSEQELRRTLREFRHDVSTELETADETEQADVFTDTLTRHSEELQELHEEIEPQRPFKKIDILGPETHRHSRWHAQAMRTRNADSHSDLVRELYTERLETLADQQGWE